MMKLYIIGLNKDAPGARYNDSFVIKMDSKDAMRIHIHDNCTIRKVSSLNMTLYRMGRIRSTTLNIRSI